MKKLLILGAVAISLSCAAKTTTFIGQTGVVGGDKLSVAANWDNGLPVAGDTLIVSSVVVSVENDIDGLSVKHLYLYKNVDAATAPTLSGNSIAIAGGGNLCLFDGSVISNSISGAGNLVLYGSSGGKLYGSVTITGTFTLAIKNENHLYAYAPVTAGTITGSYNNGYLHLCSTGNSFGTYDLWYAGLQLDIENAINADSVISWRNQQIEANRGRYFFNKSQTIDRIEGPLLSNGLKIYGAGVCTARGTANAITACLLDNSMSFVWNPVGDFTQTFTNRPHNTTGSLIVSNGTVCIEAGCSFARSKSVTVANGATLDVKTGVASAFAAAKTLTLDGTLKVASASGNPFPTTGVTASIGLNGRLELGAGVDLTIDTLYLAGTYPFAGSVFNSGNCDWIEGSGSVTVGNATGRSYWKSAASGLWSDSSMWQTVVPSTSPAFITADGPAYTVTFDATTLTPSSTTLGSAFAGPATFSVAHDAVFGDAATLNVIHGGVYEQTAGYVAVSNSSAASSVSDGGIWRVTGGTNDFRVASSGMFSVTSGGRVEVTGGRLTMTQRAHSYGCPLSFNGGVISVSGDGRFSVENSDGEFNPFGSGEIAVSGTGSIRVGRAFAGPKSADKPMYVSTRDGGTFSSTKGFFLGGTVAGGRTVLDLMGNGTAVNSFGWIAALGLNRSAYCEVNVYTGATVTAGYVGMHIGTVNTKKDSYDCFPTGVVNVAGGTLNAGGDVTTSAGGFYGTIVGGSYWPTYTVSNTTRPLAGNIDHFLRGELNVLAGGTYTQSKGYFAVGLGRASGDVMVDGGTFTKPGDYEGLIGGAGGVGRFVVKGGSTAAFSGGLFAGGFNTNALTVARYWPYLDFSDTASTTATGLVRVVDGTLAVNGAMTFGARGMGVLEVGSNGVVTASSLTLSNNVASVLSFKFGESGAGSVALSGALSIAPGAKLKIDASAYRGRKNRFRLLSAASVLGAFDSTDVEVVSADGRMTYALKSDGLYAVRPVGLTLIVF